MLGWSSPFKTFISSNTDATSSFTAFFLISLTATVHVPRSASKLPGRSLVVKPKTRRTFDLLAVRWPRPCRLLDPGSMAK